MICHLFCLFLFCNQLIPDDALDESLMFSKTMFKHFRTLQKQQNRCHLCQTVPNYSATKKLALNDNPLIQVQRQWYLLCFSCEKYYHFNCYSHSLALTPEEKLDFKADLENGARFFCSSCRTEGGHRYIEPEQRLTHTNS